MARNRRIANELLDKSREAALSAIQIFNNPLIKFKSETYIVLMIIAWTYLLHAYYKKTDVDYRYYKQGQKRKLFLRTRKKGGAIRYWELEKCLEHEKSPIDRDTKNNLLFLIELRHEIEHQMTLRLDDFLSARYQACAMNYSLYIKQLFGEKYGIDKYLTYSLQFLELSYEQLSKVDATSLIPNRLHNFISGFDGKLSQDEIGSDRFSYGLYFLKRSVNHPGQADRVIEFIPETSEGAGQIQKEQWLVKDREKPKFLPSEIVKRMKRAGYKNFSMTSHTRLWQTHDAKNPKKGYGVLVSEKNWYWYESWLRVVEQHCQENREQYI